jgi:tellurite resistance protein TerC
MLSWLTFICIILILLSLDLGIFHKRDREIGFKESLAMSAFYALTGVTFGLWVWYMRGFDAFALFITGFLVEKSLSLDNIFVISIIFSSLSIPLKYQHRVLFWGILGVIVLRGIMIGLGAQIISQFHWVLYIFSAFMLLTGIKMFFVSEKPLDISKNPLLLWVRKHFNMTEALHGQKFFVHQHGPNTQKKKLFVTPLFIALITIECLDLVFAIDSIPAIFSLTQDTYIVYTSNIFAILGLRALYFALAALIPKFYYLRYALAAILIFIGSKIFIADTFGIMKIPPALSLSVTLVLLGTGIVASFIRDRNTKA